MGRCGARTVCVLEVRRLGRDDMGFNSLVLPDCCLPSISHMRRLPCSLTSRHPTPPPLPPIHNHAPTNALSTPNSSAITPSSSQTQP